MKELKNVETLVAKMESHLQVLCENFQLEELARLPDTRPERTFWRSSIFHTLDAWEDMDAFEETYTVDFILESIASGDAEFPTKSFLTIEIYLVTGDFIPSDPAQCGRIFAFLNESYTREPGIKYRVQFDSESGQNWIVVSTDILADALNDHALEMHFSRLLDFIGEHRQRLEEELLGTTMT